ncbi:MAG: hypothetical protein ACLP6E_04670 [Acidimicrobiales bacterium]
MSGSGLRYGRGGVASRGDELEIERDFLLKSLQDLEEEHVAGDVSDDDYTRLRDRYTARAAEVLRAIDSSQAAADRDDDSDQAEADRTAKARVDVKRRTSTGRTKAKSPLLVGGVICLLAGVTVALVVSDTSARLPGNTDTGGVTLSPGQQVQRELSQAGVLQQEGQIAQALQVYQQVLSQEPGNADALCEAGWLEFEAGVLGGNEKSLEQGESYERSAVSAAPGLPSARAYLGSMFFVEGEVAQAVVQYREFLADKPTAAEMSPFLPDIRRAFSETKTSLPSVAAANPPTKKSTTTKK